MSINDLEEGKYVFHVIKCGNGTLSMLRDYNENADRVMELNRRSARVLAERQRKVRFAFNVSMMVLLIMLFVSIMCLAGYFDGAVMMATQMALH